MLHETLESLCQKHDLSKGEAEKLFSQIVRGELTAVEIGAVLVALKCKGETPAEIAGAAQAMRAAARPFPPLPFEVADTCGTGGDAQMSVNISTAVAVLAAEAGLPVAKHGNRSVSSRCGSADVLEQVGVKIDAAPEVAKKCLEEVRICFLFAPYYHQGVKHAMPVRQALKVRTIFNVIGPLANPAAPSWQIVGTYDPALCRPVARTLSLLGCRAALVVHCAGLDELGLHAPTQAVYLHDGAVEEMVIDPQKLGLPSCAVSDLKGGDAEYNAQWLRQLLAGQGSASHNAIVALNAGALLFIAGKAKELRDGVEKIGTLIEKGEAVSRLERWANISRGE